MKFSKLIVSSVFELEIYQQLKAVNQKQNDVNKNRSCTINLNITIVVSVSDFAVHVNPGNILAHNVPNKLNGITILAAEYKFVVVCLSNLIR